MTAPHKSQNPAGQGRGPENWPGRTEIVARTISRSVANVKGLLKCPQSILPIGPIGLMATRAKRAVLSWRLARLERRGPCAPGGPRPFDADLSLKIDVVRTRLEAREGGTV